MANLPLYIQITCIQCYFECTNCRFASLKLVVHQSDLTLKTLYQNVKQVPWVLPGFPADRDLLRIAAGTFMKEFNGYFFLSCCRDLVENHCFSPHTFKNVSDKNWCKYWLAFGIVKSIRFWHFKRKCTFTYPFSVKLKEEQSNYLKMWLQLLMEVWPNMPWLISGLLEL